MGNSVNSIPSRNVPFVDNKGLINPIWHEFLRNFISKAIEVNNEETEDDVSIIAGSGLTGGGELSSDVTLNVGAGSGILVNGDDVSIDITNQSYVQASLEDEVMITDFSDQSNIKKTRLRDIAVLGAIPGGSSSQIQYNDAGVFGGDTGFTTNGAGSLTVSGDLTVDNLNFNGNSIISTNTNGNIVLNPNGTGTIDINGDLNIDGAIFTTASSSDVFRFIVPTGGITDQFTFKCDSFAVMNIESGNGSAVLEIKNDSTNSGATTIDSRIAFADFSAVNWCLGMENSSNNRDFSLGTNTLTSNQVFTVDSTNRFFTHFTSMMRSITANITASTVQTQGQGALTADINEISTCANTNDTVTLPSAVAARSCLVINNGAQTLQVFPASGDNLGAGLNTATTITAGSRKWFIAYDTTNWEPVI